METITYLLKVNLYWILFYGWYLLMLRNHTFFKLNRLFLVFSLIISLLLPAIEFPETIIQIPSESDNISGNISSQSVIENVTPSLGWELFASIFYAGVTFYLLFRLLKGFYNLGLLIRNSERLKFDNYTLVLLPGSSPHTPAVGSFSFFKWLVVSTQDYNQNLDTIIQHEAVHIRQFHSLDIILIEVLKIFFWFNPVLWFYKSSIREVHEFLADEQAENRDSYAIFLVSYAQKNSLAFITNQFFNASLLKDRVRMLYKNRTSNRLLYQYLMIVPVILLAVFMTAARPIVITHIDPKNEEKSINVSSKINSETKTDPVPNSKTIKAKNTSVSKNTPMSSVTSDKSAEAIEILEAVVQDTTIFKDNPKKRYYTNFNYKLNKVITYDTSLPALAHSKKSGFVAQKYWKDEPPKTQLNRISYPMLDYSPLYRSEKADTISKP